jgi:hypothetical protein
MVMLPPQMANLFMFLPAPTARANYRYRNNKVAEDVVEIFDTVSLKVKFAHPLPFQTRVR